MRSNNEHEQSAEAELTSVVAQKGVRISGTAGGEVEQTEETCTWNTTNHL